MRPYGSVKARKRCREAPEVLLASIIRSTIHGSQRQLRARRTPDSHQVIRVYARILEFKKTGEIFDLHVDDICQQILTLGASVEGQLESEDGDQSNDAVIEDLESCQLQILKHLDF